jgi:hypothetical protein
MWVWIDPKAFGAEQHQGAVKFIEMVRNGEFRKALDVRFENAVLVVKSGQSGESLPSLPVSQFLRVNF